MWAVTNTTPFAAHRAWVRDTGGQEVWVVAVKASYNILPGGKLEIARQQAPVALAPRHTGEPGQSSLYEDAEADLRKPYWDLVVHGTAFAPRGEPVRRTLVSVRLGNWRKAIQVHGKRWWTRSLGRAHFSEPEPFVEAPLSYEHAFGGVDPRDPKAYYAANPVGRGFSRKPEDLFEREAPTLELEAAPLREGKTPSGPAGFGPIDRWWSPRSARAGTYDREWERSRRPLLPSGYDERFRQCAPDDQQFPERPRGGEIVEIEGMSPAGPERCELPRLSFGFRTDFGSRTVEHRGELQSVVIEMNQRRLSMVYQTQLPCTHRDTLKLKSTLVWLRRKLGSY